MPLYKDIKYPANALLFTLFIWEVANFDLLPTDSIDDHIHEFPEDEPFNINFEACGLESVHFTVNTGSVFWIIKFFFAAAVFSLLFYKVECIWKRLG